MHGGLQAKIGFEPMNSIRLHSKTCSLLPSVEKFDELLIMNNEMTRFYEKIAIVRRKMMIDFVMSCLRKGLM